MAGAVILAAGDGRRLRTELPKPLHRVCGRALLDYALDAAAQAGAEAVAVVAPASEAVSALIAGRAACVPAGPSLAAGIRAAAARLPEAETLLLLPCDVPQLDGGHLRALLAQHEQAGAAATRLVVGGAAVAAYAARRQDALDLPDDADLEDLFPEAGYCERDGEPLVDVDTRRDLARAEKEMRRAVTSRLMDEGVTFIDPENTYIDAAVKIGVDTVVYPWTIIEGETEIGPRCTIGPHARLINCRLEEGVTVEAALLRDSVLRRGVRVGPFANVRPGCDVGAETKLGDFVELKNARVGERVSIAHLAYVGDAEVGDGVNIGAGVITCNYDGVRKNRTTIGADAFIGSNSVLIAPVTVGEGAYVAANSAINVDVPEGALGIGRARQENKADWVRRRREKQRKE